MFTPKETQINTDSLHRCRTQVSEELLPLLSASTVQRVIPLGTPINWTEGRIAVVRSGCLSVEYNGRVVILLEEGDLLGPWMRSTSNLVVAAKGAACEITEYGERDLIRIISSREDLGRIWYRYVSEVSSAFFGLYGEISGADDMPTPRIKSFRPGEVILEQGQRDDDVYSIVEGAAEVVVDGIKVGTIGPDEIFGVIAALTGAPRSATVTAVKPVLTIVFDKNDFHAMLRSHPTLVIKMMEDMARVMRELNDRVVNISRGWTV